MSLTERTQQLTPQEEHRLKRENASLRHQLKEAMERHDRNLKADSLFERAAQGDVLMPEWSVRKQSSKKHQIIPVHLLSDFHFDEVVELSQTNGKNEYNRKIAERRLKRNFLKVGEVCRDYVKGFHYPGIVVCLLGDNFSGNIHEELKCTNEDTILGSLYHWLEPMGAGLKMLADEFGKVTVVSVVGNHGRNSIKPISKNRVRDNFDWLFSALLKRQFDQAGDKRFTWIIAEGHKQPFSVYDTKFLASHGDEAHGGSGIASLLSPLMIQAAKLKRLHDYDYWLIGHWHQLAAFKNVRVNGCFTPGQLVCMPNGTRKPIELIQVGETVVTRTGNHKVAEVFAWDHNGSVVNIRCGTDPQTIQCTPNHEIFAVKQQELGSYSKHNGQSPVGEFCPNPRWIKAEDLGVGDYIQIATGDDGDIELDKETAWLLGVYLAEGSSSGRNGALQHADTTHHIKEKHIALRVKAAIEKQFPGVSVGISERPAKNTVATATYSKQVAEWFVKHCGRGCANKVISDEIMQSDNDALYQVLVGWLQGDGSVRSPRDAKSGRHVSGKSVSRPLIEQMHSIAVRCGLAPTMYKTGKGGPRLRDSYQIGFCGQDAVQLAVDMQKPMAQESGSDSFSTLRVDGRVYVRITNAWRSNYSGPVHDLGVAVDHSYSIAGFTVHNSGKGFDEYATIKSFEYQVPQQDLFFVSPEHGITASWPIFLEDK